MSDVPILFIRARELTIEFLILTLEKEVVHTSVGYLSNSLQCIFEDDSAQAQFTIRSGSRQCTHTQNL